MGDEIFGNMAPIKALRILRVFKILRVFPPLKILVDSIVIIFPLVGNVVALFLIMLFIFSVIGVNMFAGTKY
jgi:hypothetical protein